MPAPQIPSGLATFFKETFVGRSAAAIQAQVNAYFAAVNPAPGDTTRIRGITASSAPGDIGVAPGRNLWGLLKASGGELPVVGQALMRWAEKVSSSLDSQDGVTWEVTFDGVSNAGVPQSGEVVIQPTSKSAFRLAASASDIAATLALVQADLVAAMNTPDVFEVIVVGSAQGWLVGMLAIEE